MKLKILGVPFNGDGTTPSKENPAKGIRDAGLLKQLEKNSIDFNDLGDIEIPSFNMIRDKKTKILNLPAWQKLSLDLSNHFASNFNGNYFNLVLGGDCSILIGIYGAFIKHNMNVGLVYLDGHADYRTPEQSPTGEPADLVLSTLTGNGPKEICGIFTKIPMINEEEVIVYGFREPDFIEQTNIKSFDRQKMNSIGIEEALEAGLGVFKNKPLWIHYDVDVLDPTLMPVCFPEKNGLSYDEVERFLNFLFKNNDIIGMTIACYHQNLDTNLNAGKRLVTSLVKSLTHLN